MSISTPKRTYGDAQALTPNSRFIYWGTHTVPWNSRSCDGVRSLGREPRGQAKSNLSRVGVEPTTVRFSFIDSFYLGHFHKGDIKFSSFLWPNPIISSHLTKLLGVSGGVAVRHRATACAWGSIVPYVRELVITWFHDYGDVRVKLSNSPQNSL
jgi:hypothetical protein